MATTSGLRGAVVGLGMIGRHHARILQSHPDFEFAGAVDPGGDRYGAIAATGDLLRGIDELIERRPDFAVVAVPTGEHLATARELTAAGIHLLVEKPLARDSAEGSELIELVRDAGLHGAVGHVERFNPAFVELRRQLNAGALGDVYSIDTDRIGPYPDRIRDVGVVMDLGVHDLDLVRWLGGGPVDRLHAETQHRMGSEHEDLVHITGQLAGGQTFSCSVNWISPRKVRRTQVIGKNGMFVADTLNTSLTFTEFDGGKEGEAKPVVLDDREPLAVELEGFAALIVTGDDSGVVSLEDGLDNVALAEAALRSAATGASIQLQALRS